MKKTFLIILLLIVTFSVAYAKSAVLSIQYTMDEDYLSHVTEFRFYMENMSTGEMVFLASQENVRDTEWTTPTVDVPAGQEVNYYLSAVYTDGKEVFSVAYPFALRGIPTIFSITRIE